MENVALYKGDDHELEADCFVCKLEDCLINTKAGPLLRLFRISRYGKGPSTVLLPGFYLLADEVILYDGLTYYIETLENRYEKCFENVLDNQRLLGFHVKT